MQSDRKQPQDTQSILKLELFMLGTWQICPLFLSALLFLPRNSKQALTLNLEIYLHLTMRTYLQKLSGADLTK